MRVISGIYRHRNLISPKNLDIRPSKDMVKEGMFSALNNYLNNKIVLDLFAGSGGLGIEAISRGAKKSIFVDYDLDAIKTIKSNLLNLKINNGEVYNFDYLKALNYFKDNNFKFDIVILDPPYKMKVYKDIFDFIINNKLINDKGIFVFESDYIIEDIDNLKSKNYKYGKTYIKIIWL